jgi:ATP-dependent exoDNAse (exonuclease V) beta subunit
MVFIDEAQDFDPMMLKMLLRDTTIPKIFVGDPRQAIYEWRGAVNTFDRLPDDAFVMEFYTTWRIGNPACDIIRSKFINCWMMAGNDHITELHNSVTPSENYDYLFRSWRYLLQTASQTPNIWINDYEKKRPMIEKLHNSLQKYSMSEEDKAKFEDDLPNFLLKLNVIELHVLLDSIQHNLVSKSKAQCRMYTVHAYKGMENSHIRIFNDIDHDEEENIYYVALTRGKDHIYLDDPPVE